MSIPDHILRSSSTFLNRMKMASAALVLLPFFGANIQSLVDWSATVYNLNPKLEELVTREESEKVVLDVLFFIEPAIRDDIQALQYTIDSMVQPQEPTEDDLLVLQSLRMQYRDKILELNRIQSRIQEYRPDWKPGDEK